MQAVPGGRYDVTLRLTGGPRGVDPRGWLVGAITAAYPGAEVEGVRKLAGDHFDVRLRWKKRAGSIAPGDDVSPVTDGLSVPGLPMPSATVDEVTPVSLPPQPVAVRSDVLPAANENRFSQVDAWKAVVAVVMIGGTAFAISRMGRKGRKAA